MAIALSAVIAEAQVIDSSRHSCECLCTHCERHGTGQFAQWAVLRGDVSAVAKLNPEVAVALSALARNRRERRAS